MNRNEENLIFGNLLEDISDVVVMDEQMSPLMARVHSKVAAEDAQETKEDVRKGKATPYEANQANLRAKQINYEATKLINKENRSKNDDVAGSNKKDAVGGNMLEASQATLNAQRKIEVINDRIDKINDTAEKQKASLQRQKETAQKNLEIARARDTKSSSTVGTASEAEQTLNESYSDMLFNGVYGDVLRYLITGEINNGNHEVIDIARKLQSDKEAMFYVKSIKEILKREAKNHSRDDDYSNLKILKMKLKSKYIQIKKV